jgi:hypothetical protein
LVAAVREYREKAETPISAHEEVGRAVRSRRASRSTIEGSARERIDVRRHP